MEKEKTLDRVKLNIIIGVLLGVLVVVVGLVLAKISGIWEVTGADKAVNLSENNAVVEKWQEGTVHYNGNQYLYNTSIETYLFMGIDKYGEIAEAEDGISGGQSDAMFLLVIDSKNEEISVVSINRNTMTMIDMYDRAGEYLGQRELQICLQHAYGDGLRTSCLRSVKTVENLFYNIPISGYLSLNMEGMPYLNDALGGVTVEVMDDLKNDSLGVDLKKGEVVTLNGNEAYAYIRMRDVNEFDSASRRLERQNQYLLAMLSKLEESTMKNEASAVKVLEAVEDYVVTNIDFVSLVEDVSEFEFDASQMYNVPGETIMGTRFEEYHIDEDALYDMIINVFYEQVEE